MRDVVHRAVQALAEGRLVAFPTETVYGIAASARLGDAVERLARAKGRPADVPFTLAIKSAVEALDYVPNLAPLALRLARRCWPGPVTLVVDDSHPEGLAQRLPDAVRKHACARGTLGLRVPASPTVLDVLRMLAGPIALTSANLSGEPESVTADQVVKSLGDKIDLVLDDGPCRYGQPSTVVRVRDHTLELLREGVVAEATLRRLANVILLVVCTGNTCRSPMAELLLKKRLADELRCDLNALEEWGVLVFSAGLSATLGAPPSEQSVIIMKEYGLDLSSHEAEPLSDQLVRHADLILTMTEGHRRAVVDYWPEAVGRTQLLLADQADVPDPVGHAVDVYRQCAQEIVRGIEHRLPEIKELLGQRT
jgi:protein-tyrosine phosphatase